jgi:hypothetical protein
LGAILFRLAERFVFIFIFSPPEQPVRKNSLLRSATAYLDDENSGRRVEEELSEPVTSWDSLLLPFGYAYVNF